MILDNSKYVNPEGANTLPGWEEATIGLHTDDGGVYSGKRCMKPRLLMFPELSKKAML